MVHGGKKGFYVTLLVCRDVMPQIIQIDAQCISDIFNAFKFDRNPVIVTDVLQGKQALYNRYDTMADDCTAQIVTRAASEKAFSGV